MLAVACYVVRDAREDAFWSVHGPVMIFEMSSKPVAFQMGLGTQE